MITQERLKELLDYDPQTGVFTRKIFINNHNAKQGDIAGNLSKNGYIRIGIDGISYMAHRLAWLYVYGKFPSDQTDHINMIRDDNRIANLREATMSENQQNQCKATARNKDGLLGVHFDKQRRKWYAQINIKGKNKNLGRYTTPEEAHAVYIQAKREYHHFCTI